jgi:hypothetical protein
MLRMACLQAAWEIDLSTSGGTDFKVQLCHYRSLSRRQGQNLGITNSRLESRYRAPCLSALIEQFIWNLNAAVQLGKRARFCLGRFRFASRLIVSLPCFSVHYVIVICQYSHPSPGSIWNFDHSLMLHRPTCSVRFRCQHGRNMVRNIRGR